MVLSRTVSEINGDFSRKSHIFPHVFRRASSNMSSRDGRVAPNQSSVLESVKVTVYALRYCTPFRATRRLTDYPLQGGDHPNDIGQESGCGHGFVFEFSFTRQSCHQQQLLLAEKDQGASIRFG